MIDYMVVTESYNMCYLEYIEFHMVDTYYVNKHALTLIYLEITKCLARKRGNVNVTC